MFKHSKSLMLIVGWLMLVSQAQDWPSSDMDLFEGAQLLHIYSIHIIISRRPSINLAQTFTRTIPEGIFATEDIYIAAGIPTYI